MGFHATRPQGSFHTVIRWVHRSAFEIRSQHRAAPMLVLPTKERLPIDAGWNGKIVVEAEGTNEGLADLQVRCWGAFPPRTGAGAELVKKSERERCVWRILRERRCVSSALSFSPFVCSCVDGRIRLR